MRHGTHGWVIAATAHVLLLVAPGHALSGEIPVQDTGQEKVVRAWYEALNRGDIRAMWNCLDRGYRLEESREQDPTEPSQYYKNLFQWEIETIKKEGPVKYTIRGTVWSEELQLHVVLVDRDPGNPVLRGPCNDFVITEDGEWKINQKFVSDAARGVARALREAREAWHAANQPPEPKLTREAFGAMWADLYAAVESGEQDRKSSSAKWLEKRGLTERDWGICVQVYGIPPAYKDKAWPTKRRAHPEDASGDGSPDRSP